MNNFEWDLVTIASFGAYSVPGHHLNQYWLIVNWTIGNKTQGKLNQNKCICKKMNLKISSVKWLPIWLSLNMEKRLLTQRELPWAHPLLKAALLPRIAIGNNEMNTGTTQNGVFMNTSREKRKSPPFCKRHFTCIILTENICILIQISLVMAWRRNIDNPSPWHIYASADLLVFKGTVKQNVPSMKHLPASVPLGIFLANTSFTWKQSLNQVRCLCAPTIYLVVTKGVN